MYKAHRDIDASLSWYVLKCNMHRSQSIIRKSVPCIPVQCNTFIDSRYDCMSFGYATMNFRQCMEIDFDDVTGSFLELCQNCEDKQARELHRGWINRQFIRWCFKLFLYNMYISGSDMTFNFIFIVCLSNMEKRKDCWLL